MESYWRTPPLTKTFIGNSWVRPKQLQQSIKKSEIIYSYNQLCLLQTYIGKVLSIYGFLREPG
jgi:hypothetical protein